MRVADQIVVVTGGGRGLGSAIVRAFAREGAKVVVNYHRSRPQAEALVAEIGERDAVALRADVTDQDAVDEMFATARTHFGDDVTTVVNNALIDYTFNAELRAHADELRWEDLATQFEGTVRGALHTVHAALPGMRAREFGRIINVGTNLLQNPVVPYHDYTAAKAALLSLTRTLAADLGPDGITVNMVSGGLLRTTDASAATPEAVFTAIAESTPLRRVVTPDEFADAVLFFASPWARAVTGQNLVVDGGLVKD
ncbi:3-oxoacyl-ACP reductase [Gandjariella thermophila]|uniref:3-oxoacyl-ACP reductase n=1 Tax=Gandjariella thermophila TaxID=1931992 RepID=A0A4D4J1P5_9PSEU|nr:3-oxoacyl-ACP reductase [Gandjariella thermophila]GDY29002.1 3-oxoacyl-ACP reductase [Gandjariella thermophila]